MLKLWVIIDFICFVWWRYYEVKTPRERGV